MNKDEMQQEPANKKENKTARSVQTNLVLRWLSVVVGITALSYLLWRTVLADVTKWQYGLGILLVTYCLIIVLWKLPKWQISAWKGNLDSQARIEIKDYLSAENSARSTLAQILGGIFVFVGLYFTAVSLKNSAQTLELSRQGQITERYAKAIQELASKDQPDIVIGGIYTLGRIPKESPPDYWSIMEVLTAYVRRASPSDHRSTECDVTELPEAVLSRPPRPDIQAVMNVLRQRDVENEKGSDQSLNLEFSDLTRVYLRGAHLENALFDSSVLNGATVDGKATLQRASFQYASLSFATFEGANLRGAVFTNANCLMGTKFKAADLRDADFRGSRYLLGTDFTEAVLTNAEFTGVDLSRVVGLTAEQIKGSKLTGATLPDYLKTP